MTEIASDVNVGPHHFWVLQQAVPGPTAQGHMLDEPIACTRGPNATDCARDELRDALREIAQARRLGQAPDSPDSACGVIGRYDRPNVLQTQLQRERVADTLPRRVGIRVRCQQRTSSTNQCRDHGPLRRILGDRVDAAQKKRMMRQQHIYLVLNGLLRGGTDRIDGQQDAANGCFIGTDNESDPIPRFGRRRRPQLLRRFAHISQYELAHAPSVSDAGSGARHEILFLSPLGIGGQAESTAIPWKEPTVQMNHRADAYLEAWKSKQQLAEGMIPLIGQLYRDHDVVMSVHGRSLVGRSAIDIVRAHSYARKIDEVELPLEQTSAIVESLARLQPGPVSVDLALLAKGFRASAETDLDAYLSTVLEPVLGGVPNKGTDVVLYGFGRIGRLLARIIIEHSGSGNTLNLRAIVVRKGSENDLIKRANLLRRDSVHGPFNGTIKVLEDENAILANGVRIQVIYSNDPASVDYSSYGIEDAILVDNTGKWRDTEGLEQHLRNRGISKVLLTAPGKGDMLNVVYGVNNDKITDAHRIVSAASCTTNAITPVLKELNDTFGVVRGHVETVHAYTNDQNLIDNFHKGDRRGRSAALNMVLTETGAAKAVAKALPEFEGKLTGNAIRVPTPDVSMAVLNLQFSREVTREEINAHLEDVSLTGSLRTQIDYVESPEIVSTDFVGSNRAGIVDGLATIATGDSAVVYVWYDNEYGYSCQVVRIIEQLAGNHPLHLPMLES